MLPYKYYFSLDFNQVSPTKAFGKWVLTPVLPLEQTKGVQTQIKGPKLSCGPPKGETGRKDSHSKDLI